jgi:cystathionine beta-lyase/cystathionine gamma-synthase
MIERIFNSEYMNIGSGIQPFNAWLLLRGLRTLPIRLEKITKTTQEIVDFLQNHSLVEQVIYPLDPSFKQVELAKQQMSGGCGLLTFMLKVDSVEQIENFCNALKHVLMAVSWGGYESLIIPKCATMAKNQFNKTDQWHKSLRLYVGLEEADYIIKDLENGFLAISSTS